MRYVITGLLAGMLLAFVPVFDTHTGFVLQPLWYGALQKIQTIEPSSTKIDKLSFAITTDSGYYHLDANGAFKRFIAGGDNFIKPTIDGNFYISYKKVGNDITMYNATNEIFWKIASAEYPYSAPDGSIIVLLTADGSSARIADFNGNIYANTPLNGQFCTAVAFSPKGGFAGIGFIDGRFYIVNSRGQSIYAGQSPESTIVKGIAIDSTGQFAIVHCGDSSKDSLIAINIARQKTWLHELSTSHHVKTALAVNSSGHALFLDMHSLLAVDIKGKDVTEYPIVKKRYGQSQINSISDIFTITYPAAAGGSVWYIWDWNKGKLYSREFFEEPFLYNIMSNNLILLQGQEMLACFAYQQ